MFQTGTVKGNSACTDAIGLDYEHGTDEVKCLSVGHLTDSCNVAKKYE